MPLIIKKVLLKTVAPRINLQDVKSLIKMIYKQTLRLRKNCRIFAKLFSGCSAEVAYLLRE